MPSFTERMNEGRANAANARYMGRDTGKQRGHKARTMRLETDHGSWAWLCRETRAGFAADKRQIENDFAQAALNSGLREMIATWEIL